MAWCNNIANTSVYKRQTIYYHAQTPCDTRKTTRTSQRDYTREQHDDTQTMSRAKNKQIINENILVGINHVN
jgi:hypothetical protein